MLQECRIKAKSTGIEILDEKEIQNHITFIKDEIKVSNKKIRMLELKNWLNSII